MLVPSCSHTLPAPTEKSSNSTRMPRDAGEWIAMRQIRAPSDVVSHAPEARAWGTRVRRMPVLNRGLGSARRANSPSLSGPRRSSRGGRRASRMPGGRTEARGARSAPHARRAYRGAWRTFRSGVNRGLLARDLLCAGQGDTDPYGADRDEE